MMAARMGRTAVVSLLIEVGANADLQNKVKIVYAPEEEMWFWKSIQGHQCLTRHVFHHQNGDSALMLAVKWGRTEVVSLLIEVGANAYLQNKVK